MSQAGYTPISLYYSTTASAVPLAANLAAGELAINTVDGKLYYKTSGGVVTLLASSTTVTNSFSAGTTGLTPNTATTGAVTLAGTLITSNGGTGLASYTAGDLSYFASGTALTKLSIGTAGQILTSSGTAPQWSTLSGVAVTTFSAGTTGFTPSSATSGAITLAGTLATTNGGTGLTSFTANGVVYASSSSALATGSALVFDGTNLGVGVTPVIGTLSVNTNSTGATANGYFSLVTSFAAAFVGVNNTAGTIRGVSANSVGFGTADVVPMTFGTSNTEAMRIGSNSNVAIGQTGTSGSRLNVTGANSAIGASVTNGSITLRDANSSGATNTVDVHIRPSAGKSGGITFTEDTVADRWAIGIVNGNGSLFFRSGQYNGTERVAISSTGDFTLNGAAGFNVLGFEPASAIGSGGVNYISAINTTNLAFKTSSTERARIDTSGNFLVGRTSATGVSKVGISGNSDTTSGINLSYSGVGEGLIRVVSTSALTFGYDVSNGATERMRIDVNGNVGINTVSPSAKLQIDSGDIRLEGSAPGKILFFSTGNGVSQNATLEVANDGSTTNTGEFKFSTRNVATTLAERVRIYATGLLQAYYGSYADPSISSSGSNGLQIVTKAVYNDSSSHVITSVQDTMGVIQVSSSGLSSIPFYANGGGGVAYGWTVLNPQTGVWTVAQGPTIIFSDFGTGANTYTISFSGGSGQATIQRTAGAKAYTVAMQAFCYT